MAIFRYLPPKFASTSVLVIVLMVIFAGIHISFSRYKDRVHRLNERSRILEEIEAIMFLFPEKLDSLVGLIDTTRLSSLENARLGTIRAKMHIDKGNFANSIAELEKADSIFLFHRVPYHLMLNRYIKATVFEKLLLFHAAAELFLECDLYFREHKHDKLRFYSSLGLLRLRNELKINTGDIIRDLENDLVRFNDPLFNGLFYATIVFTGDDDSVRMAYFELATSEFLKAEAWSRVYTTELNMLFIKIRQDPKGNAIKDYYSFPVKAYSYTPNQEQQLQYLFAEGYLYTLRGEYQKAVDITHRVLKEARALESSRSEMQCINLLETLYRQKGDYRNAHLMLVRYQEYNKREMDSMEQVRIMALGAHYRFTRLEHENLKLKARVQRNFFIAGTAIMLLSILYFIQYSRKKQFRLKLEISELRNMEIEEQLSKLHRSFERSHGKNEELIGLVVQLEEKYRESKTISRLMSQLGKDQVTTWPEFETRFHDQCPGWIELLSQKAPELSPTELRYCMCIRFNLNNFQISGLLSVGDNAVKSAKKRIRDKLGLKHSKEIYLFLRSLRSTHL